MAESGLLVVDDSISNDKGDGEDSLESEDSLGERSGVGGWWWDIPLNPAGGGGGLRETKIISRFYF